MQNPSTNWPPDFRAEFITRTNLLKACTTDSSLREALMLHYTHHPIDWIKDWAITYDPRVIEPMQRIMPFVLFKRQEEFIQFLFDCVTDKECGLIEKSRDIGATWAACSFSVWLWLFKPGTSIGWGSRKEMLVDRIGDPDSIFQKLRMIIDNLPAWMLPVGFTLREHASFMKIVNPVTKATITGEGGDSIGRGGRSMIYFKDESAHYERPELIEASLGDNTDVQIDISSVHGTNNVFYRRRMAGEEWRSDTVPTKGKTRVFVFDWRDHPGKTQAWYGQRRAKAEAEGLLHLFAQEVDRDYAASIEGVIIPTRWIKAAIDAHIKLGFGDDGKKIAGLDVADEGGDKNALAIRYGVVLRHCDVWGEGDTGRTARRAIDACRKMNVPVLNYDSIGVGAGVKAETNRLLEEGALKLSVRPYNAGAAPWSPQSRVIPGDVNSPKNEDFFANLKAQGWWLLRTRFEKTYKAVTQGVTFPSDQLISIDSTIPYLHEIEIELSQATNSYNGKGKMLVDKKPNGGKSPNLADAIVMCYNPKIFNGFLS